MSKKKLLLGILAVTIFQVAYSQEKQIQTSMDEVVITATRYPKKQNETGKIISVISRDAIEKAGSKSLPELLNEQSGLTINGALNNLGTNQTVYMRGSAVGNTLILIDGIPINDPSNITNDFDLNTIDLRQVEKIEILKGAQSTLYGSNAVAGVINIIMKKASDQPITAIANIQGGSFNTKRYGAGISGLKGKNSYNINYSGVNSRGFSSAQDLSGNNNFEKDGFDRNALSGNYSRVINSKLFAKVYGQYTHYNTDVDAGAFADELDFEVRIKNLVSGLNLKYQAGNSDINLNYQYNYIDRVFEDDSTTQGGFAKYSLGEFIGHSHYLELLGRTKLAEGLELIGGGDFRGNISDQSFFSLSSFGPFVSKLGEDSTRTRQYSAFASLLYSNPNGFNAEAGGRYNHHSIYGSNGTFSVNPSYKLLPWLRIFGNVASAYRVPSLYQLFSEFGNKSLQPEKSITYEGGFQLTDLNDKVNFRAVYFNRAIDDVIAFFTDPNTFASFYINADKQKDHGVEVDVSYKPITQLKLTSNYSYVDGEVIQGSNKSFNLWRRPKHTFNFNVAYSPCSKVNLVSHFRTVSKRFEPQFGGSPFTLSSYYTVDFYADYQLKTNLRVFADIKNLTDQQFFEIRGFNSMRIAANAGISLSL